MRVQAPPAQCQVDELQREAIHSANKYLLSPDLGSGNNSEHGRQSFCLHSHGGDKQETRKHHVMLGVLSVMRKNKAGLADRADEPGKALWGGRGLLLVRAEREMTRVCKAQGAGILA